MQDTLSAWRSGKGAGIKMKYPDSLKPGGTIGFAAPSFGCAIEPYRTAFQNAQKKWTKLGYSLDLGPNCYAQSGIGISNTPKACGEELTEYYCSEDNDCIISCGGGELMCEILDYVDFQRIGRSRPKWFMGYSDNTNLTFLLATICDTASLYGPCAAAFGMEPWHKSLQDAMDILTQNPESPETAAGNGGDWSVQNYDGWEKESLKSEEQPLLPYNITEPLRLKLYRGGQEILEEEHIQTSHSCSTADVSEACGGTDVKIEMEGRLLGGCMDCLVNLLGTKYDKVSRFQEKYKQDGIVWFLESCDLNPMGIRRAMWQMEHAGWFRYVKGFIIGRPLCHGQEMMGADQYNAVLDIIAGYDVPVIMDADLGHLAPMMPMVTGSYARVQAEGNRMKVDMFRK